MVWAQFDKNKKTKKKKHHTKSGILNIVPCHIFYSGTYIPVPPFEWNMNRVIKEKMPMILYHEEKALMVGKRFWNELF